MCRHKRNRQTRCFAGQARVFKPAGIQLVALETIYINEDELEALVLADFEGHYHEESAKKMDVSRATFGRILEQARYKVADALVHGKALIIKTTNVE